MCWKGRDNGNEHPGSPARRGPVQGGTLPHPSGAWEGVRVLADKPAHGYAGRRSKEGKAERKGERGEFLIGTDYAKGLS